MGTPVKRRGRPPGSRNKNTLAKEAATGPATSVKPGTTHAAGDRAVVAQKRKRDEYECDVVTFLRRGGISILEALAVKLPDVFAAEILPKLDMHGYAPLGAGEQGVQRHGVERRGSAVDAGEDQGTLC